MVGDEVAVGLPLLQCRWSSEHPIEPAGQAQRGKYIRGIRSSGPLRAHRWIGPLFAVALQRVDESVLWYGESRPCAGQVGAQADIAGDDATTGHG